MKRKKIQIRKGNRKESKICEQLREEMKVQIEGEGVKRGRGKSEGEETVGAKMGRERGGKNEGEETEKMRRERKGINTMSSDVLLIGQAPMLHKQVHTQLQHV